MAQQIINNGTIAGDGTGEAIFYSFEKANANFTELYNKTSNEFVIVRELTDLPNPVANIITLSDNYTYLFTKNIDLSGNRLVCGENTVIIGTSSENARITSTGLVDYLVTSNYSLPIRNITFEAQKIFNLQGDGVTTALDWSAVNVQNAAEIGSIKDYSNVIISDSAFFNSSSLIFDGTIGTIGINNTLIVVPSGVNTGIILPDTCIITRRFRIIYSAISVGVGANGLAVDLSANIPVEGYILDTVNFSGAGTYLNGFDYMFNEALFVNNKGIQNTRIISNITMSGNATPTIIGATNTPVKVLGTTINNAISQKFDNSVSNRSKYKGVIPRLVTITSILTLESSNNNQIGCYIAKNGIVINESETYGTTSGSGRAENIVIQTITELVENDEVEVYVENATAANNITVTNLNTLIQ